MWHKAKESLWVGNSAQLVRGKLSLGHPAHILQWQTQYTNNHDVLNPCQQSQATDWASSDIQVEGAGLPCRSGFNITSGVEFAVQDGLAKSGFECTCTLISR